MSALFMLVAISILVAASFLAAFLWSVLKGQYEDDYTPSVRMLFDEGTAPAAPEQNDNQLTKTDRKNADRKI